MNHPWSGKDDQAALKEFKRRLPAIAQHLLQFRDELQARTDQGTYFWELRSCDYWDTFDEPKIVFNETSKRLHAYVDTVGNVINKTGFIILHPDVHYILAVLNSTPLDWFYRSTFPSWGDPRNAGRMQFRGAMMNKVPIPSVSRAEKSQLSALAKKAAERAENNDDKGLAHVEREIDAIVYKLFDLAPDEIKYIEDSLAGTGRRK